MKSTGICLPIEFNRSLWRNSTYLHSSQPTSMDISGLQCDSIIHLWLINSSDLDGQLERSSQSILINFNRDQSMFMQFNSKCLFIQFSRTYEEIEYSDKSISISLNRNQSNSIQSILAMNLCIQVNRFESISMDIRRFQCDLIAHTRQCDLIDFYGEF